MASGWYSCDDNGSAVGVEGKILKVRRRFSGAAVAGSVSRSARCFLQVTTSYMLFTHISSYNIRLPYRRWPLYDHWLLSQHIVQ